MDLLPLLIDKGLIAVVVWVVLHVELRYLRRDIDACQRQLKLHMESPHERRIGNLKRFQAEYQKG